MHGDEVHAVDGLDHLRTRSRTLIERSVRTRTTRDSLASELAGKVEEIERVAHRIESLMKVNELLHHLLDLLVRGQVRSVESLVTEGLRTIFHDQNLVFEANLVHRRNRAEIDFTICQGDPDKGGIRGEPLESFGGGPSSIASLVLRVLVLLRLKRHPVMALDETLAAVSDEYIDTTGQFLDKLCRSTRIDALLVTHKASFLDHAKRAYIASDGCKEDGSHHLELHQVGGRDARPRAN